jgi:hypothetical protein
MATSWDTEMVERLERVERKVDHLEGQFDRLEARLDTFATKADFERFATKADLERFATKADLERFATKTDLERFATKADLERFATKAEVEQLRDDIKKLAEAQAAGVQLVLRHVADISKNWDMKWSVHDLAIRDHTKRIGRLERRGAK